MFVTTRIAAVLAAVLVASAMATTTEAKDKVKVGFIGPLTGGVSVNGIGGRNSADLSVRLRNSDAKAKYEYELVVHPRLAGHGPALFAGLSKHVDLKLVGRQELGSGAVAMQYEPRR